MRFYLLNFPEYGWDAVYWACVNPEPKFDLLTPEQKACVDEFVEVIHEEENRANRVAGGN